MAEFIEARVIQKIATASEWATSELLPYKGEVMLVSDSSGKVLNIKIGDGIRMFPELDYMFDTIQQNVNYIPYESTPSASMGFTLVGEGSYANGVVVDANMWAVLYWDGSIWTISGQWDLPSIDVIDGFDSNSTTEAGSANNSRLLYQDIYSSSFITIPVFNEGNYYSSFNGAITAGAWAICTNKNNIKSYEEKILFFDSNNAPVTGIRVCWWDKEGVFGGSPAVLTTNEFIIPSNCGSVAFNAAVSSQTGYTVYTKAQIEGFKIQHITGGNSIDLLKNDVEDLKESDILLSQDIESLENKTDIIIEEKSINLIDKSKIILDKSVSYTNGTIIDSATSKLVIVRLPKLNTQYSIVGFSSTSLSVYNNTVVESDLSSFNSSNRVQRYGDNSTTLNQYEFNSGSNGYYLVLRINSGGGNYDSTVMLYEGTLSDIPPYEPYYDNKGISWDNVLNKPSIPYSNMFYEFILNGGQTSTGRYIVYSFIGEDRYVGFNIDYVVNESIRANLWRIRDANLYIYNGTSMVNQSTIIMHSSENEYVYAVAGQADSIGGFHGDEELTSVSFFINESLLSIPSVNVPLTACNSFKYGQKSETFLPSNPVKTNVANHTKITEIKEGGYTTYNKLEFLTSLSVNSSYGGLCCVAPAVGKNCYSKQLNIETRTGGDGDLINESGSLDIDGQVSYYNETNFLSSDCDSRWINVKLGGVDVTNTYWKDSEIKVWDRTTDAKYYHRVTQTKNFVNGDHIQSIMNVRFKYK